MTATLEPVRMTIDVPMPPEPPAYFERAGFVVGTRSVPTLAGAVQRWLATGTDFNDVVALAECHDASTGETTTLASTWNGERWSAWRAY